MPLMPVVPPVPPIADPYRPHDAHEFGLALTWRLGVLGLTRRELATRIGTRPETVSAWALGHGLPCVEIRAALLRETGVHAPDRIRRRRVPLIDRISRLEAAAAESGIAASLQEVRIAELLCRIEALEARDAERLQRNGRRIRSA